MHLPEVWEGKYKKKKVGEELGEELGYHSACVDLAGDDLYDSDGYLHSGIWHATNYGGLHTEPLPSFEENRLHRLKDMFVQEIATILGGRLPFDVCENIGRYCCLREYATRLFTEAWSNRGGFRPEDAAFRVTKSHSIWAQHIEFEGLKYMKSLSTTRRNESDTNIFAAESGKFLNIYIGEDCLDIREVIITQDDKLPSLNQDGRLRWVVHRNRMLPFWFKVKSDTVLPNDPDTYQLAPQLPYSYYEYPKELVIHAVDWNTPGCRGYSVLMFDNTRIWRITPNDLGESSLPYPDINRNLSYKWVYIPIDPDERVSELWLRQCERLNPGNTIKSLVVLTNKGRSFCLGPHMGFRSSLGEQKFSYEAITELSPTKPSRMFYCHDGPKSWLGFEQATTWDQRMIERSLGKASHATPFDKGELYHSSSANLEDVSTISVCRSWKSDPDKVVGMLFTYADGRQRCIGQIRLEYMEAPMKATSGKIWLGCSKNKNEHFLDGFWPPTKKINWVGVDEPFQDGTREYLEVPLTGSLEWQSYGVCNSVLHHESSELQHELDEVLARDAASGEPASKTVKTFFTLTEYVSRVIYCIKYMEPISLGEGANRAGNRSHLEHCIHLGFV
ncbi:hypothetical protein IL306_001911 [Fusarium sp. DS 682]|nr:hypothetical protein IL306_001911 [Fusarium sp. DS 682]